ncbi:MAG: YceI family protein [Actinomycetes bacterium]
MSRRALVVGAIVVVVLGLAGAAWYAFGGSDPEGPQLPTRASGARGPTTIDGDWTVRPTGSFVGYRISERFVGGLADVDAVGRTSAVTGGFRIGDARVTGLSIEADLTALASDKAARDAYLDRNALETGTYPTARFVVDRPVRLPGRPQGTQVALTLVGRLTLHGVTRPFTIPVKARWNGGTIDVIGTAPITLAEFGISTPRTPVVTVADRGTVEVQLVFVPR